MSTGIITKSISRICSYKANRSSAIVIDILYSTCVWETVTIEVFDLIGNIISRVSTITWQERKIDSMNIGKGGALNRGLKLIKQLIRVFGAFWRDISDRELRLIRCSADLCHAMVELQLRSSF